MWLNCFLGRLKMFTSCQEYKNTYFYFGPTELDLCMSVRRGNPVKTVMKERIHGWWVPDKKEIRFSQPAPPGSPLGWKTPGYPLPTQRHGYGAVHCIRLPAVNFWYFSSNVWPLQRKNYRYCVHIWVLSSNCNLTFSKMSGHGEVTSLLWAPVSPAAPWAK